MVSALQLAVANMKKRRRKHQHVIRKNISLSSLLFLPKFMHALHYCDRSKMKRESVITASNGIFGGMSVISSYNVCHSLCMGIISVLTFFGIAVVGFPLAFLIPYQIYFWIFGITILAIALSLYRIKGPCISKHMILANSGLLLAGVPFLQDFSVFFLVTGGFIVTAAITLYFMERRNHGK